MEADQFSAMAPTISRSARLKVPTQKQATEKLPTAQVGKVEPGLWESATSSSCRNDFPRFLAAAGKRITAAAVILVKICRVLERDLQLHSELQVECVFPTATLQERVVAIFQRYLKAFGIAFDHAEVAGEEGEHVKMIMKKTNRYVLHICESF